MTEFELEVKAPFERELKSKPDFTEKDPIKEDKETKDFKGEKELKADKEVPEDLAGGQLAAPALDRESLLRHAEALEQTARALRHFIERTERPDLRRGALRDEEDQGDGG